MRGIAIIDILSGIICILGILFLLLNIKGSRWQGAKLVLLSLLFFKLCYSICMLLEWSGMNTSLERLEDFFGALLPMCWAFTFYAFAQEVLRNEVQENRQRLNQALDATNTGVWHFNPTTMEVYFGARWFTMLGYENNEYPHEYQTWIKLIHPEDLRQAQDTLQKFLDQHNDIYESKFRMKTKDGSWRWILAKGRMIESAEGDEHLSGTHTDITNQVMAEVELAAYRNNLEHLVEQRTEELASAQDKLLRTERMAALGQLTATVAHEIRNPLGTIRNSVFSMGDAVARNQLDRVNRAQGLAERNIKRCDRIIQDLLDYSRKREPVLTNVNLDNWILNFINELNVQDDIQLTHTLSAQTEVNMDIDHMYRALTNTLNNAFQSFHGCDNIQKHIHILTCVNKERVEIQVMDTGVGIPEENMAQIFEPLFSTKTFGIGLGVPIIRNIMEEHNGGVDYQSQVNKGTTVTLWFPRAENKQRELT